MAQYPILFNRSDLIEGNGFIARVSVAGRALLTEEADEIWVEGVNPGGFAATGESLGDALNTFCAEYLAVLFDIAGDASSIREFKEEVGRFFGETNQAASAEWDQAVQEVREGRVTADWLIKRPAETPLKIEVSEIRKPKAENNEEGIAAIAA